MGIVAENDDGIDAYFARCFGSKVAQWVQHGGASVERIDYYATLAASYGRRALTAQAHQGEVSRAFATVRVLIGEVR